VLQKDDLIEMFGKRPWDKEEAPEDSYSNEENTENNIAEQPADNDSTSDTIPADVSDDSIQS
jgi:hypothetical protein